MATTQEVEESAPTKNWGGGGWSQVLSAVSVVVVGSSPVVVDAGAGGSTGSWLLGFCRALKTKEDSIWVNAGRREGRGWSPDPSPWLVVGVAGGGGRLSRKEEGPNEYANMT
ncbi:hypothetical protein Dimus_018984 [Dionaea muscipula]